MISISLCMIVKNEEQVLARCLESVQQIADEIIIVDTGSTDSTIEIAKKYTNQIYAFPWNDDFAAARNFSFSKASMEYILWLDADDVIDATNIAKFQMLKETMPAEVDIAMLKYNVAFDEQGRVTFSYFRERLMRRDKGYRWNEPVHEFINISGNVQNYEVAITHADKVRTEVHSNRNLNIYRNQIEQGKPFSARANYYYARELKAHNYRDESISQYQKFLATPGIWSEDAICAAEDLADLLIADDNAALNVLFASFTRDLPRAGILCRIGAIYKQRKDYQKSIFWYKFALEVPRPGSWGFIAEDYWGFIPHMQLCVLYDMSDDKKTAQMHHIAAKAIKPDASGVLHNERYFSALMP